MSSSKNATLLLGFGLCLSLLVSMVSAGNVVAQEEPKVTVPAEFSVVNPEVKEKLDAQTVKAVNQIPGANLQQADMVTPELPEIKGFHPIKRLFRPIERMQVMMVKLQQQIMRLEGPIAGLQPPMLKLQHWVTRVDQSMGEMQGQIGKMEGEVGGVRSDIAGVRSDLSHMRKEISALKEPIQQLREPLAAVGGPLSGLEERLIQVQGLIATVLLAIMIAAVAIAVGTPIAAILVYRNRHKIFPDLKDKDLPKPVVSTRR